MDVFVEELDLRGLGFKRVDPLTTGRPAYHPAVLLKLYIKALNNRDGNFTSAKLKRPLEQMQRLHVLAYNLKRVINILGAPAPMGAMSA